MPTLLHQVMVFAMAVLWTGTVFLLICQALYALCLFTRDVWREALRPAWLAWRYPTLHVLSPSGSEWYIQYDRLRGRFSAGPLPPRHHNCRCHVEPAPDPPHVRLTYMGVSTPTEP